MALQFKHLNVPDHWQQYWTKYPEGYTILESLINWTGQVDHMVDDLNSTNVYLEDFTKTFDKNLQGNVIDTLKEWQDSGFLDVVINAALQTQIDDVELEVVKTQTDLEQRGVNVKSFGAKGDGKADDTNAFKAAITKAISMAGSVFVPNGEYVIKNTIYTGGGQGFTIEGESINDVIIKFTPSSEGTPLLYFTEEVYKASFKRLNIIGAEEGLRKGIFIQSAATFRQSVLEDLSFSYIHTAFEFRGEANALIFNNCRSIAVLYHIHVPNETGNYTFNQVSFYNCNFRATRYGIYIHSSCNNVTFYDCIFDIRDTSNSDGKGAIYFTFPRNISIVGGYIEARDCSVLEFDHTRTHTYDMQVNITGVYFINNGVSGRSRTGLKVNGRVSVKVESCYFNGWDKAIDAGGTTGTLILENNSFANNNTNTVEPSSGTTLREMRGIHSSGQNSNGDWIRYADGSQECWFNATTSATDDITWTFPNTFANTTHLSVSWGIVRSFGEIVGVSFGARTAANIALRAYRQSGSEVQRISAPVYLIAKGRWK